MRTLRTRVAAAAAVFQLWVRADGSNTVGAQGSLVMFSTGGGIPVKSVDVMPLAVTFLEKLTVLTRNLTRSPTSKSAIAVSAQTPVAICAGARRVPHEPPTERAERSGSDREAGATAENGTAVGRRRMRRSGAMLV